MYVPTHFEGRNEDAALDLIEAHPLGILVCSIDQTLDAAHLPFVLDRDRRVLRGHVARANTIWRTLEDAVVLVVFSGPDAYISPDWYVSKDRVPTWNYQAVHVGGQAHILPDTLMDAMLADLTDRQEQQLLPKPPWTMDKLDMQKRTQLRRAIVGFEVSIETVRAKDKLSQDKNREDRDGAIAELRMRGGDMNQAMADLIGTANRNKDIRD